MMLSEQSNWNVTKKIEGFL